MQKLLRRVRGALGMGLTWGLACGALLGPFPRWVLGMESDLPFGLLFAGLGFISGVIFSAMLVVVERKRRFDQLSIPRFAVFGATGGLIIAAFFVRGTALSVGNIATISALFACASAACATGSLLLARRAATAQIGSGEEALLLEGSHKQSGTGL